MLGVFFFQAEDGIRDKLVTGVQTCALPISEYRPHEVGGERAAVRARQAREHAPLAAGRVHTGVRARLLLGDRDGERSALVQETEDLVVDPVDVPPERGNRGLARHAALGARSSAGPALLQTYAGGRSTPKRR